MATVQNMTVVSADGHVGGPVEMYRPYIDPAFRDRIDDLAEEEHTLQWLAKVTYQVPPDAAEFVQYDLEKINEMFWNVEKRLAVMDSQGIAGEFVILASIFGHPFFTEFNKQYPADLRTAGVRAYHRWVADLTAQAGGRLIPNGEPASCEGLDEALVELAWVAEHGFTSVSVPGLVRDTSKPLLSDRYWDPFWSACEDLDLALNMHAGWGLPQGPMLEFLTKVAQGELKTEDVLGGGVELLTEVMGGGESTTPMDQMDAANPESPFALDMGPRQGLWRMMLGGVFDRHPTLKVVLTEMRADWVPATLAHLDRLFDQAGANVDLKPSEYWYRNCAITPSAPHQTEIAMRHEIGLDGWMFGADIPHKESTWPNTQEWLGHALAGIPEDDARKMVGGNAIDIYRFDREKVDAVAAKIGPTAAELLGGVELDERLLANFDLRASYRAPVADIDIEDIDKRFHSDLARTNA